MKAAIYARYSTDKQSDASIEDQVRVCMHRIERDYLSLVDIYQDEGISGSVPVDHRVGGSRLLKDALAGAFDVLIIEGLDRLSRDLVEQERIVRRLEHRDIKLIGVSDGYDTRAKGRELMRGMRGLINEVYLSDLKAKTHRGMTGKAINGFATGGAPFGYRNVRGEKGSAIEVDQEAAEWVTWIFERFVEGLAFKRIAEELNRLKVKPPRGDSWGVSSIYGSPKKGSGILNNELYVGRRIWNRSRWVKDPDTMKRVRLDNPESDWIVEDRPDLAILDPELWQKARDRMTESRLKNGTRGRGAKPLSLFGGLLMCGKCGGTVIKVSGHSYGCSNNKNRGASVCEGVTISQPFVDRELTKEIRKSLLSKNVVEYVYKKYKQQATELAKSRQVGKKEHLEKLAKLNEEIERYVDAIGSLGMSEAIEKKLKAAEIEKKEILELIEQADAQVELIEPKEAIAKYKRLIDQFDKTVAKNVTQARMILKELIGTVEINKENDGKGRVFVEFAPTPSMMLKGEPATLGLVAGARSVFRRRIYSGSKPEN